MRRGHSAVVACLLLVVGCSSGPVRSTQSETISTPATTSSVAPAPTTDAGLSPGDDVGDPLFAGLGNPGLDVQHYDVSLDYHRPSNTLAGTVVLDIVFTEDRQEFTLDALGPLVSQVTVDDAPADFEQADGELRVTPDHPVDAGSEAAVAVVYSLNPEPASVVLGIPAGWVPTEGGSYVLNEPEGTRRWLPCNDHPSDKATWRFAITVPAGVTAVANGALIEQRSTPDGSQWVWEEDDPMATYLTLVLTGDYEIIDDVGPDGMPLVSAVLRDEVDNSAGALASMSAQIEFFEQWFGPYPFDRYGLAISDSFPGLAMETQGRSMFSESDLFGGSFDEGTLAHELAHQWFGDAVTPADWGDIWLNESFATYAQWMWVEHIGGPTVEDSAQLGLEQRIPMATGSLTQDEMFGVNAYDGGAVVLHALRGEVGDGPFFDILRTWVVDHFGASASTEDFIAVAERVTGRSLTDFFDTWLFSAVVPDLFPG